MLNNFSATEFLSKHWQKSPCLIKKAYLDLPDYVTPDELAGLSLEEDVESRIIRNDQSRWQLLNGPFEPSIFQKLPETHWTLLVQTFDYWCPEVIRLLEDFNFLPRWRFDDLMVSYATNGGGVGPHYDNYDVFLIQVKGQRHWRVGTTGQLPESKTVIEGLKHLEEFDPLIDVIMEPGDMLYIPPETAHWGESIGESIGYSVGYRSAKNSDIFALLANHFETSQASEFFKDDYRSKPNFSNQLEPELLDWAKKEILKTANNQELIASLLGSSLSTSKIDTVELEPIEKTSPESIHKISKMTIQPGLNANWYLSENNIMLNIEGETYHLEKHFEAIIKKLLAGEVIDIIEFKAKNIKFDFSESLARLIDTGYFLVE